MRRGAALAVLAVLVTTGCGSAKDTTRRDVNRYVKRVNALQVDANVAWVKAEDAYRSFGRGRTTKRERRELAAAPAAIGALRSRIAAVPAPAAARRLRQALLRLLDADASFARQVALFGGFVADVRPVEADLSADTDELRLELHGAKKAADEQQALRRYAGKLDGVLARLRALRPPSALAPWHRGQIERTEALRRGALELDRGIATHDGARAAAGLGILRRAAAGGSVTKADRAAIVAYNHRLVRIGRLAAAVAREQARLVRELT